MSETRVTTHPSIDDELVVEHYVTGRLSADEVEAFEEHYLGCAACVQAIEDAERLQRGLARVAAEDLAARQTVVAAAWRALRSGPSALLATVLLVVALLPAGLAWRQARDLDASLDEARAQLVDERRPRLNTPILRLAPTRSVAQPLQQISVATEPEWLVLAIELDETASRLYEVELATAEGDSIWRAEGLEPDSRRVVSLSLHSSLLPPGRYILRLVGDGQRLEFPLRVVSL